MSFNAGQFAEKYQLALESAAKDKPAGGLNGFELEWNLLDEQFRPLLTVGAGPAQQSFVDYLRGETLSPWMRDFSQLEVFHWMIELATRPYYSPRAAVYEARLMEAVLINALARAGPAVRRAAVLLARQPAFPPCHQSRLDPRQLGYRQAPLPGALRRPVRQLPRHGRDPRQSVAAGAALRLGLHAPARFASGATATSTSTSPSSTSPRRGCCAPSPRCSSPPRPRRRSRRKSATAAPIGLLTENDFGPQSDLPKSARDRPAGPVSILQGLQEDFLRPGAARRALWKQQLDARAGALVCRTGRAADLHDRRPAPRSVLPRAVFHR